MAPKPKYNINKHIKAETVLVIDNEKGESLGVLKTSEAVKIAEDQGMDLVEVNPKGDPPVCKILDYSKFKYTESKKERKAKSKGKQKDMKEMRFPVNIDIGDINHKLKKVKDFLKKGHRVKMTIRIKGRPAPGQDKKLMTRILTELEKECKIDQAPKYEGRNYAAIILPSDNIDKIDKEEQDAKDKDTQSDKKKV